MCVVYFDQLLSAVPTGKLVETLFWAVFNPFVNFKHFLVIFRLKSRKNVFKTNFNTCFYQLID